MNKRYVVGLGEVLWDVLPEGKKLGGAPANFAYHAGQFLGSILSGKSVTEAHQKAVQVSAYVCTQNGAMPTLPAELLK